MSSRKRFGGKRYSGGNRRRFQNKRRGKKFSKKIDPQKYVSEAVAPEKKQEYAPSQLFADFALHAKIKENIARKKYVKPTEIQDKAIPAILKGSDVMGIASTGSGKTDSFVIPMAHKLVSNPSEKCLIIAPTRELAMQIEKEVAAMVAGTPAQSVLAIGGVNIRKQFRDLKRRYQFLIATPGRLKDLHERKAVNLKSFNNIVLDEVDRMLDMGFVNEIKYIISQLGKQKQTLFFSATMSKEAEVIARTLLKNPIRIQIAEVAPHKNIHQDIVKISNPELKIQELVKILRTGGYGKTIVFGRTKRGCDKLSRKLLQEGFKTDTIHGDKSQYIREKVLKKFKNDTIRILVATDVAARGIHVNDIDLVVNYDEPETYDDYIHRIGRTGRAGKTGNALTFVN